MAVIADVHTSGGSSWRPVWEMPRKSMWQSQNGRFTSPEAPCLTFFEFLSAERLTDERRGRI